MLSSLVPKGQQHHVESSVQETSADRGCVWTKPARQVTAHLETEPAIRSMLGLSTRVREGYTVGQHTEMVLNQEERYLLGASPEHDARSGGGRGFFRKMLAAHDLAKYLPDTPSEGWEAGKEAQGLRTAAVLDEYADFFALSRDELKIAKYIICSESLPNLLRSIASNVRLIEEKQKVHALLSLQDSGCVPLVEKAFLEMLDKVAANARPRESYEPQIQGVVREVTRAAVSLGTSRHFLWDLSVRYFQCDASAYTFEAHCAERRGVPSLEFLFRIGSLEAALGGSPLFIKHAQIPRILFSEPFEPVVQELYDRLR
jgi:hypothetical protein